MASKWNALEQGGKRRRANSNQNRKSTDTMANSGKPVQQSAPKPTTKQKSLYYKSKDDARPAYRNPAAKATPKRKPARSTVYYSGGKKGGSAPRTNKWGVDFGWDYERDRNVSRAENYTNDFRVRDDNSLGRMKEDAAPGSNYRMRNWINSRARTRPKEDKGSTLAQVNRTASLYGAVAPTTKGYTPAQARDIHREAQNAPVALQDLWIKYGGSLQPMVDAWPEDQSDVAHFDLDTGRVYGVPGDIAAGTYWNQPYRTHWHEYGHNLDALASESGMRDLFSSPSYGDPSRLGDRVRSDTDRALRDYWANVRMGVDPYDASTALAAFGADMQEAYPMAVREASGLSDMMGQYGAVHGGNTHPIGMGHAANYWRSSRNRSAEAFADLTAAATLGGPSLRYVQAVLPETYDTYLAMLTRMVNGG